MNAYVQPMFDRYVDRLERGLADLGFAGRLHLMTSSGASIVPETARRFPVRALESGPAAGALMSAHHGRSIGIADLLSFDMGGTTAKGALIRRFAPLKQYDLEVGRVHEFKRGSGLPAKLPVIDMIEIGSGGGSLARVDERGLIRVGPQSAGADPGPACYGKGGTGATLTDANVVLGYLDPRFLPRRRDAPRPGRRARRDRTRRGRSGRGSTRSAPRGGCTRSRTRTWPARSGSTPRSAASTIEARPWSHSAARGRCTRSRSRASSGSRVSSFPIGAGVMSALGLLVSPLGFEVSRSRRVFVAELDAAGFDRILAPLVEEASGFLRRAGIPEPTIVCRLDMRYQGQGYEIEVTLPGDGSGLGHAEAFPRLQELFRAKYAEIFAETYLDEPLEIVSWKVEAAGSEAALAYRGVRGGGRTATKRARRVWFGDSFIECEVLDRYALEPGAVIEGPAVVEERESTCVLGPGDRATVDERLNLVAALATEGGDT